MKKKEKKNLVFERGEKITRHFCVLLSVWVKKTRLRSTIISQIYGFISNISSRKKEKEKKNERQDNREVEQKKRNKR